MAFEVGYLYQPEALRKKWGIPLTNFTEHVAKADWAKQLRQEPTGVGAAMH